MKKKHLFAICCSLIYFTANAYNIKRVEITNGLSNNYVHGIAIDKQGLVWVSTRSGLNRFDGNNIRIFKNNPLDTTSINSNELNMVYADKFDNIIWIGTERNGLNYYDYAENKFHHLINKSRSPNSLSSNGVTGVSNDSQGNIWIATYSTGVDNYNKKTKQFIHFNTSTTKGLGSNMCWCAVDDNNGNLYIGHVSGGFSIINIKKQTAKHFINNPANPNSLPGNDVRCIFIDSQRQIWIGTNKGLALYNPVSETFVVFRHNNSNAGSLSDNKVFSIYETTDHKLWVGTYGGGINILNIGQSMFVNPSQIVFEHIEEKENSQGLSSASVNRIIQDAFGNVWIGTLGGGINFIGNKENPFNILSYSSDPANKNSLSNKYAWGVCFDKNNYLWVATEGGGVDVFLGSKKVKNLSRGNSAITDNRIAAIYCDSYNNIWIGSFEGNVWKLDGKSRNAELIKNLNTTGVEIRCFIEDSKNDIWIGTNEGIRIYNHTTKSIQTFNTSNSKLSSDIIRSFGRDDKNRIWIGTLVGGVTIFDKDYRFVKLWGTDNGFYGVNHIYKDYKNRIWVATREDLIMFPTSDSKKFKRYGLQEGIYDNYTRCVIDEMPDKMWIGTNSGMSSLDIKTGKIKNYTQNDGIAPGSYMSGAITKSAEGVIYMGSQNGVCYFNPMKVVEPVHIPPVIISNFSVIDKKNVYSGDFTDIPVSESIDLKYYQNTIHINFNTLDYSLSDKVEFSYQLKGLDNTWYTIKNEKELTFRNLRPGKYQLSIRSRLRQQEWNSEITTMEIDIHPPFWYSWWAYCIYLMALSYIAYIIIRFYKNKVNLENSLLYEKKMHDKEQKFNEERLQFYTNITHELRTPLTLILGPLDDILSDKSLSGELSTKVGFIHKSANRLLDLINQLLEFRKSETGNRKLSIQQGNIIGLINDVVLKFSELNLNNAIDVKFTHDDQQLKMYFDPEIITIILDNLLSNALKYTAQGTISVSVKKTEENDLLYTDIRVSDTGYGISKDALPNIFNRFFQEKGTHHMPGTGIGLSLVKSLVDLHQGSIQVESVPNEGTSFTVRLLTENEYPDATHSATSIKESEDHETDQNNNEVMMIVEDNAEIRDYIASCFSSKFEIVMASDGQQGFELAKSRTPDIIISDIMMPVMDGIEMCRKIKEDMKTSHIPIVLLTAKDSIHDKTIGYEIGVDSYITKPFNAKLLQSRITNIQENRSRLNALYGSVNQAKQTLLMESLSKLDNEFIDKIKRFIEDNLESEQINVNQIADQMFMSRSTLYRKLKALTGLSINEFVRKTRIQTAEKLLLTGKYTTNEIIFMVGINSMNYFRECFKEEYGMTPKEYIQRIKNGEMD